MSFHVLSRSYANPGCGDTCGSSAGANNVAAMSANPMNFTENQQGNVVLEKLRHQRDSGRFCDVVLVVRDRQFPAHRNILAACSPYFDSILRMHKVVKEQVTVTCQSADVFELLLNYMYSGNVVIDRNNVMELLKLSHNFLVSKLKNYCAEYLDRYLDAQTCLCVKDLADKYNMPGLAKNAAQFIETNINVVLLESQDLLEYPICRAEAMLCDKVFPNVTLEAQLRFVARYVRHRPDDRESQFGPLLASVRAVPLSTDSQAVLEFVDREPLFQLKPSLLLSLLQYAREHGLAGLYDRCERLHQSSTTSTCDVSIYFNNGHSIADGQGQSTSPVDEQRDLSNECNSSPGRGRRKAVWVKQEPPETPPPSTSCGQPPSDVLSPDSTPATAPMDFPPLRIKLRLNDRNSATIDNADGRNNRQLAASRNRLALSENGDAYQQSEIDDVPGHASRRRRSAAVASVQPISEITDDYPVESMDPDTDSPQSPRLDDSCSEECSFEDNLSCSSDDVEDPVARGDRKAEILFKCPHCIYTSGSQSRIQSHLEKAHSKNRTFACTVCSFECKWNREYYTHMKEHFQGPPFCCDSCDYIAERIQMLLTHRMKHTNERPFQCKQCDYRCRTKTNLVAHMRSHTGEKPFTCPSCCRSFAIKSTLDQHLATHSDARPFVCDQCSFSTKYQSHLISHKRIHSGDVFRCQYPECTYSSPKKSQLAAHMRTHMAVRAHVCKQCARSFIEKSHLVRHERIHLQIKPFKCDQCNYASSRRDKLKEHVQKHHVAGDGRYRNQASGKSQSGRAARRNGGRPGRMSFVFGADAPRHRRLSSGGRYSSALTAGRPHSSIGFRPVSVTALPSNPAVVNTGSIMDFNSLLASPTCATDHVYHPSPFEGAALNDGDVLLSTQAGGMLSDSPQSTTNSLLSDPFPSAATPASDPLQRPMSLPPLGAQAAVAGEFNLFE